MGAKHGAAPLKAFLHIGHGFVQQLAQLVHYELVLFRGVFDVFGYLFVHGNCMVLTTENTGKGTEKHGITFS
jgi:hypothetical protein